jgi:hypothetical protein
MHTERAGEIGRHRLLDHDVEAAARRHDRQLRAVPVVREDVDSVHGDLVEQPLGVLQQDVAAVLADSVS